MTIYLNNLKHGHLSSSYLKSSGKLMPCYFITAFILFNFHTSMRLSMLFLPSSDKTLPHLYILDLHYVISFILIIFILSTQKKFLHLIPQLAAQFNQFYLLCWSTRDKILFVLYHQMCSQMLFFLPWQFSYRNRFSRLKAGFSYGTLYKIYKDIWIYIMSKNHPSSL